MNAAPFLQACRGEPTSYTPIWLMRQAGRYMPEYRAVRDRFSFLDMCKNPDAAAEVTITAVDVLGVDAAIIFADILLIVEPLGAGLEFTKSHGPEIARPVRGAAGVDRLPEIEPAEHLSFVFDAIRKACGALPESVPLIGFAGAPFTVASYLIEGHGSRQYLHTKELLYRDPGAWHALLSLLARATAKYLNAQIDAGARAVQLFDSWVGCLAPDDYREFVLPHTKAVIDALVPGVPVVHFGTDATGLLDDMKRAGGHVLGLDWRVDLADTWERLGDDVAVQGNLDPAVLLAPPPEIRRRAKAILDAVGGRPGHVFNLGHGVLPNTPVDHARLLVDTVHELSQR